MIKKIIKTITILVIVNLSIAAHAEIDLHQEVKTLTHQTSINPDVLTLALKAFNNAEQNGISNSSILTVVDYSLPSTAKRMWIFDIEKQKVLFNTLVAHGKNSGENYANSFSDQMGTLKSSIGLFVTANTYSGNHGYSLRLKGLETGINDKAEERNIVMHGAWYVNESLAKEKGSIGRSWGCLAVKETLATPIINTIKDGTLIFVYYPSKNWLSHSKYLALN